MPTPTYDLIASNVLSSSASSVTFSSVSGYRDLVLVVEWLVVSGTGGSAIRLNADTGANYSTVLMSGNGSSASSTSSSGDDRTLTTANASTTERALQIHHFFDASATDKHKTMLFRGNRAGQSTQAAAARYASTLAITSITALVPGGEYASGSTFYLYGIVS